MFKNKNQPLSVYRAPTFMKKILLVAVGMAVLAGMIFWAAQVVRSFS